MLDQTVLPDELLAAAQNLLQVAMKHKTMITGFALSEDDARPFIMPFGTLKTSELTDPILYNKLCALAIKSMTVNGPAQTIRVGRPD